MNFAQLMTYWKMKDFKMEEHVLYEKSVYGSDRFHSVIHLVVKNSYNIAHIVYTHDDGRMRLLNADIMHEGYGTKDDEIWIKKASITELVDYVR